MSKLNYNRRTFLSKEELQREQLFRSSKSLAEILLTRMTKTWGIVEDKSVKESLMVTVDTNPGTIRIAPGYALTSEYNLITVPEIRQLEVPQNGQAYYVILAYKQIHWEEGTVSVDVNGNMEGVGTDFMEVLRGQGTQAPINIKFAKADGSDPLNGGVYEVVEVINSTSATINAYDSVAEEKDLKLVVLGTLPIGTDFTDEQKEGLYTYDSYDPERLLTEGNDGNLPSYTGGKEFPIAKVTNNGGTITVEQQDTLREYWTLY